ncbi:MAG: sulfotransferase domain-containing protein [Verrucomicrobiota bacterium]
MIQFPNLFIIGAPKCGTTSLFDALVQHPEITGSNIKEPVYLCSDLERKSHQMTRDEYLNLFDFSKDSKYYCEASVLYLYSQAACREICLSSVDPKIIIMLRNPIDFIESLYSHNRLQGYEGATSLKDALALEKERRQGKQANYGPYTFAPIMLQYLNLASFTGHIKRYFSAFPRSSFWIETLDKLRDSPVESLRSLSDFLEIDDNSKLQLPWSNKGGKSRVNWLHQLMIDRNSFPRRMAKSLLPDKLRSRLFDTLWKANTIEKRFDSSDYHVYEYLLENLSEDVDILSTLLDRDFKSEWNFRV